MLNVYMTSTVMTAAASLSTLCRTLNWTFGLSSGSVAVISAGSPPIDTEWAGEASSESFVAGP